MTLEEKSASDCFGGRTTDRKTVTITKEIQGFKIGEKVDMKFYGTFGGWSEDGRWVCFYSSKQMEE